MKTGIYLAGLIVYHFAMRILAGETLTAFLKEKSLENRGYFRQRPFEPKLYRFLRVKKWKGKAITAKHWQFDMKKRSPGELLFFINQAELVHTVSFFLSFLPLCLIPFFGRGGITLLLSAAAAAVDLQYIIIQRFNRPRVEKLCRRTEKPLSPDPSGKKQ